MTPEQFRRDYLHLKLEINNLYMNLAARNIIDNNPEYQKVFHKFRVVGDNYPELDPESEDGDVVREAKAVIYLIYKEILPFFGPVILLQTIQRMLEKAGNIFRRTKN